MAGRITPSPQGSLESNYLKLEEPLHSVSLSPAIPVGMCPPAPLVFVHLGSAHGPGDNPRSQEYLNPSGLGSKELCAVGVGSLQLSWLGTGVNWGWPGEYGREVEQASGVQ